MKLVNPIGRVPTNKEDFKAHLEPRACMCGGDKGALFQFARGPNIGGCCTHCGCICPPPILNQDTGAANYNVARSTIRTSW